MDPSGTYLKFDAKAIGSGSEGAQQSLQVLELAAAIFFLFNHSFENINVGLSGWY
jgi:hypothetical protein